MPSTEHHAEVARKTVHRFAQPIGQFLTETFHYIGLFAIGAATVWAGTVFFIELMSKSHASIEDLLLLFIYLEIGSMVGIYFKTNHMPLRFLIYIGITALTRHLIGWVNHEPKPDMGVIILSGGILILAVSVLVIRYSSYKYPSGPATPDRGDLTDTDPGVKN
ncbi:MAG: phosphate-starvation-inducible protein PsiE [Hyphomicrobiaceae bacterium]